MKIHPRGDRLLVKLLVKTEHKTAGGFSIQLPENQRERPDKALVVEVGPGAMSWEPGDLAPTPVKLDDLAAGDIVLVSRYGGIPIQVDGDPGEYLVIRNSDVMAKIDLEPEEREGIPALAEPEPATA